jgi:ribosomal protein S14
MSSTVILGDFPDIGTGELFLGGTGGSAYKGRCLFELEQCPEELEELQSAGCSFERVHRCRRTNDERAAVPSFRLSRSLFRSSWSVDSDDDDDSEY